MTQRTVETAAALATPAGDAAREWLAAAGQWSREAHARKTTQRTRDEEQRAAVRRAARAHTEQSERRSQLLAADIDDWLAQERAAAPPEQPPGPSPRPASSPTPQRSSTPAAAPAVLPGSITGPNDPEPLARSATAPHASAWAEDAAAKQRRGDFAAAAKLWRLVLDASKALSPAALAPVHSNLAGALIGAQRHSEAQHHCGIALDTQPSSALALARSARCYLVAGNHAEAAKLLRRVPRTKWPYDLSHDLAAADHLRQYQSAVERGNYAAALGAITAVCSHCTDVAFEVMRLDALAVVAPDEALDEAAALAQAYPMIAAVRYWHALFLFRSEPTGQAASAALDEMQAAATVTPQCDVAAKGAEALRQLHPLLSAVAAAHGSKRWAQCLQACNGIMQTEMLGHRKLRSFIHMRRATALYHLEKTAMALADCTDGLLVVDTPFAADLYALRAECHLRNGEHGKAVRDAQEAYRLQPSSEAFARVERFKQFAGGATNGGPKATGTERASAGRPRTATAGPPKPPTHYELLGVPRDADTARVAKAYRQAALLWHPDKWAARGAGERRQAEERFKAISHAHSVLCDAAQRRNYDRGL